jgi:hypothetical protein
MRVLLLLLLLMAVAASVECRMDSHLDIGVGVCWVISGPMWANCLMLPLASCDALGHCTGRCLVALFMNVGMSIQLRKVKRAFAP